MREGWSVDIGMDELGNGSYSICITKGEYMLVAYGKTPEELEDFAEDIAYKLNFAEREFE